MLKIFSRKTELNTKGVKFIGAYLPQPLNSFLSMWCISMGVSKTTIIIEQLERWKETLQKSVPIPELEKMLAQKALKNYYNLSKKNKISISLFLIGLDAELLKKGVDETSITVILKSIENATD